MLKAGRASQSNGRGMDEFSLNVIEINSTNKESHNSYLRLKSNPSKPHNQTICD